MVAHTYNSSYLGGRAWEDHSSRRVQEKKIGRAHLKWWHVSVIQATREAYREGSWS
jgi:hypothetical protein